jgi:hypothetical protein
LRLKTCAYNFSTFSCRAGGPLTGFLAGQMH